MSEPCSEGVNRARAKGWHLFGFLVNNSRSNVQALRILLLQFLWKQLKDACVCRVHWCSCGEWWRWGAQDRLLTIPSNIVPGWVSLGNWLPALTRVEEASRDRCWDQCLWKESERRKQEGGAELVSSLNRGLRQPYGKFCSELMDLWSVPAGRSPRKGWTLDEEALSSQGNPHGGWHQTAVLQGHLQHLGA